MADPWVAAAGGPKRKFLTTQFVNFESLEIGYLVLEVR